MEQHYIADYEIQATRVTRNEPGPSMPLVENVEISKRPILRVQDDLVMFEWQVFDVELDLHLTNKAKGPSGERLTLLLDRAEFIDSQGQHGLVFFYSTGNPGKEKKVSPGKSRTYQLVPAGYKEQHRTLFGPPIAGRVAKTPQELQSLYAEQVGRTFRVRLPVQVGTRVWEYELDMKVSRIVPRLSPKEWF